MGGSPGGLALLPKEQLLRCFAGKAGAVPNSRLGSVPGCPGWPQGGTRGAHKAQVPAASPARDASTWIWDHPRCGNRQHHAGKTRHPREMRFSLNICPFLTLLSCLRLGQKELGDRLHVPREQHQLLQGVEGAHVLQKTAKGTMKLKDFCSSQIHAESG